jgi:hypothetical protein
VLYSLQIRLKEDSYTNLLGNVEDNEFCLILSKSEILEVCKPKSKKDMGLCPQDYKQKK